MITIRLGQWPSGLYSAELRSPGGTTYAPFVVAPRRLGQATVGVVLPTRTWQAYNGYDANGDGVGDSWYHDDSAFEAPLGRPYDHRGVSPRFAAYDRPFLQWLHRTGRAFDVLAQEDLEATTGAALSAAYDLLVFPGHHEYVTEAEHDAVTGFRDRGGNLAFLSANNFFWSIEVRGGAMVRGYKWRTLGRPEAALVGVQYAGSGRSVRGQWRARRAAAPTWLFAGVPLGPRGSITSGGIEVDAVAPSSPRGTRIVAAIPNVL
ncbi:MAG: N,N-dimethylformamidase beta subunit family domain-containing protein, partial [Actinomycetota bacterium]